MYQQGGTVNAYNSLFADNGYDAAVIGVTGPDGADYFNAVGNATLYSSILGSNAGGMGNTVLGSGSTVASTILGPLTNNGGSYTLDTLTIALLDGIAIGGGTNPINQVTLFTDQRGYVPTSAAWDVGAYQTTGIVAPAPTATLFARQRLAAGLQPNQLRVLGHLQRRGRHPARHRARGRRHGHAACRRRRRADHRHRGQLDSLRHRPVRRRPIGHGDLHDHAAGRVVDVGRQRGLHRQPGRLAGQRRGRQHDPNRSPRDLLGRDGQHPINKFGLSHKLGTGLWTGSITLTNTGTSAFSGPIFILFDLPGGAMLENATGTYGKQPYLEVNVASLAAGATTGAITVTFNMNVAPASYSTSFYLGSLGS